LANFAILCYGNVGGNDAVARAFRRQVKSLEELEAFSPATVLPGSQKRRFLQHSVCAYVREREGETGTDTETVNASSLFGNVKRSFTCVTTHK
jgi:hypothetical protein